MIAFIDTFEQHLIPLLVYHVLIKVLVLIVTQNVLIEALFYVWQTEGDPPVITSEHAGCMYALATYVWHHAISNHNNLWNIDSLLSCVEVMAWACVIRTLQNINII